VRRSFNQKESAETAAERELTGSLVVTAEAFCCGIEEKMAERRRGEGFLYIACDEGVGSRGSNAALQHRSAT
jgi:hypothetical protein